MYKYLGGCMVEKFKVYNEEDIEILNNGISIENTFFSKKDIANTFNELIYIRSFIEKQRKKELL